MKAHPWHAVACILVAARVAWSVEIKQEVKVEAKVPPAVSQAPGAGVPVANAEAFRAGAMYYNAMPSVPAAAATAVKVIDSKRDIDYVSKVYKLKCKGVSLTILPTIGEETLTLAINASVNSLVGWTTSGEPIINRRTTTSTAVLQDGELFTLSGLRKDTVTKMDERVPILGSIPLIGYVFRHEVDVKKTSEIIVFLAPHKVTARKGVMDREKELLQNTATDINTPERSGMDKFTDRVLLNKK